jgi:hypothetical protein
VGLENPAASGTRTTDGADAIVRVLGGLAALYALARADAALYEAKRAGRARVLAAGRPARAAAPVPSQDGAGQNGGAGQNSCAGQNGQEQNAVRASTSAEA